MAYAHAPYFPDHMEFVKDKAVVYGYRMEPGPPMKINRYPK